MRLLIIAFLIFSIASPAFGGTVKESSSQVWNVGDRRWTAEEEALFGKWVEESITEDFFVRYQIPADCADVPYAIRWIYSRIAHLPAAATTKDGKLIGHWLADWRHLPTHAEWHKDLRFRKALFHVLSETTTRTLPLDTYPIRIDRESVIPGTAFFVTESHSGVIGQVFLDGSQAHPLQMWESTVPAKIQKISVKNFISTRPESTTYSGLVKFRWPVQENGKWQYLPAKQHPFYSEEQYSSAFYEGYADYVEAVAKRIDPTEYDPWEKMEKVMNTTARYLRQRVGIVLDGYQRCQKGGCPEGSELWEIHSTPGRDGMITLLMDHLKNLIESNHLDPEAVRKKMEGIYVHFSEDRSVTFYHLYKNHLWLSPHPEDSIEARWGLAKCELILRQVKSARNSITFIEKTYRKRDPKYADFSSQQQLEILIRLNEEWMNSQCKESDAPSPKKDTKQGEGKIPIQEEK
jgi:hypothetical protein